jgi:toxin ParE1/3/4
MAYQVRFTGRAERDLEELYGAIAADSSAAALKWYRCLKRAILTLEEFTLRCPSTPEDKRLRQLVYGRKPHVYRVIYQVVQKSRWTMSCTSATAPGTNSPPNNSRASPHFAVRNRRISCITRGPWSV